MKHFQLATLLLAFLSTSNFVYAANDHDHANEAKKHHENKQGDDKKSQKNQHKHDAKHGDHSDDNHNDKH